MTEDQVLRAIGSLLLGLVLVLLSRRPPGIARRADGEPSAAARLVQLLGVTALAAAMLTLTRQ